MSSDDLAARATALHRQAIVIDAHSDILIPITDGKMRLADDVTVPDPDGWQPPQGLLSGLSDDFNFPAHALYYGPMGQFDVPKFLAGGVTVQVCAVYIDDEQLDWSIKRGLQMALSLHRAAEQDDRFEVVTTVDDIFRIKQQGNVGGVLSFEGCEALGSEPDLLDIYHRLGLRMASLTHCRRNIFADGPQGEGTTTGGLTDRGRAAVRRMNELGIVVDLVHINDIGMFEILELTTAPVVLSHTSHTNFPSDDPSNLSPLGFPRPQLVMPRDREKLEAIAASGGVLCIIWFAKADLDDVVRDIETAIEVMGPDHVGLGSDLYGLQLAPQGLEDISKTPAITEALLRRGYSDQDVLKILGGNLIRVFREVWK
jgi:membrane dipeptidase